MTLVELEGNFKGQKLYLDGYLKSNLDYLGKDVKNDNDAIVVVSGREGSGKSWFTIQCAAYLDPSFNLDRVVFNPEDFKLRVKNSKKYQCIVYDEAITGLRAARWASEINKVLVDMLAQIRQLNLFIFIVIPSFFELGKYVAIHRSQALLMTYKNKLGKRGQFSAYSYEKKRYMYVVGKKTYNERVTKPDFFGRFTQAFPLDEAAYRKKKFDELNNPTPKTTEGLRATRWKIRLQSLVKHLHNLDGERWTDEKVRDAISESGVQAAITRMEVNHLRNKSLIAVSD